MCTLLSFSYYISYADGFCSDLADLKLSSAQRQNFAGWRRPSESLNWSPGSQGCEIGSEDAIDLAQDIATDCSVVASLCAGIARVRKGHGKVSRQSSSG